MRLEKARWRGITHVQRTFLQTLEPCVYVHTRDDVRMCADKLCNRKMCVQQVSVCTHCGILERHQQAQQAKTFCITPPVHYHPSGDKEVGWPQGHTGTQGHHRVSTRTPSRQHQDTTGAPDGTPAGNRRAGIISLARPRSFALPARTHERNETISWSGDSLPLRSHLPTSDLKQHRQGEVRLRVQNIVSRIILFWMGLMTRATCPCLKASRGAGPSLT